MGIAARRFPDLPEPFANLACGLCEDVLDTPRQCPNCVEHLFCFECIVDWINVSKSCPSCPGAQPLTFDQLIDVPTNTKEVLDNLDIHCEYVHHGCEEVLKLSHLASHEARCVFRRHAIEVDRLKCDKRKLEEIIELSKKKIKDLEEELNLCQRELESSKDVVITQVTTNIPIPSKVRKRKSKAAVHGANPISKSSWALFKEFLKKGALKPEVYVIVRHLDFDKCTKGSARTLEAELYYQTNMINIAIKHIKNAKELSPSPPKVLILIQSPFLIFAVSKLFPLCKFAVKGIRGHEVLTDIKNLRSYESLDLNNPKHVQSVDIVLTDMNQTILNICVQLMKIGSKAVNCVSGLVIYHRTT